MKNIKISGFTNTWSSIDEGIFNGEKVYLMENDVWGDETAYIIIKGSIDKGITLVAVDVWNGLNELEEIFENGDENYEN